MRAPEPSLPRGRRAAFLDRDGTLIHERHFLADPAGVELIDGAAAALRALRDAGFALILVTNQSGIARGLFGEEEFRAVQARLTDLLAREGARLDGSYHCPHHPEVSGPCDCRKPAPGLFLRAAREHGIDLSRSIYIGDRLRDVLPGVSLGGTGYLVRTGYGEKEAAEAPPAIRVVPDLAAAVADALGRRPSRGRRPRTYGAP